MLFIIAPRSCSPTTVFAKVPIVSRDPKMISLTHWKVKAPYSFVAPSNQQLNNLLPVYARTFNLPVFNAVPSPTVSMSFTGTIFAYAVAYDWSKGHEGNVPSQRNKVLLHGCKEDEVRKRPPKPGM